MKGEVARVESGGGPNSEGFFQYTLNVGTVISVQLNPKARKPAYHMVIDFGPLGILQSSAQLTRRYTPEDLVGRQIVAVTNLPARHVAGVRSQVLVLGAVLGDADVILLNVDGPLPNGTRIG